MEGLQFEGANKLSPSAIQQLLHRSPPIEVSVDANDRYMGPIPAAAFAAPCPRRLAEFIQGLQLVEPMVSACVI